MGAQAANRWEDWGVTVLRIVVGVIFLVHGGQKLFVWGFAGVAAFLEKIGIPAPALAAPILTLVEFLGGVALILGLYARVAALLLAVDMLVAILAYHLPHGFFVPSGVEYPLTLLAATVALALLGSGEASLDRWLRPPQS